MTFNVRTCDLRRLNSATKYPSIPTYHELDPKNGGLLENAIPFDGDVLATEKIDGTNARIVFLPDDSYLIGSREEFLFARGDLIGNPALGIVSALKDHAETMRAQIASEGILAFYCEVFGGKVTAASKQYTGHRAVGFRLFDVIRLDDIDGILSQDPSQISNWREAGGQTFVTEDALQEFATDHGFDLTPRVLELPASDLPSLIDEGLPFLQRAIPQTQCTLDDAGGGRPEGIVVRTRDRIRIAKLRFQDYERTMKRRSRQQKGL